MPEGFNILGSKITNKSKRFACSPNIVIIVINISISISTTLVILIITLLNNLAPQNIIIGFGN